MKVVLVRADDWEGVFVNGNLYCESHEISFKELMKIASKNNINLNDIEEKFVTDDYYDRYLSVCGNFPNNLSEVELVK